MMCAASHRNCSLRLPAWAKEALLLRQSGPWRLQVASHFAGTSRLSWLQTLQWNESVQKTSASHRNISKHVSQHLATGHLFRPSLISATWHILARLVFLDNRWFYKAGKRKGRKVANPQPTGLFWDSASPPLLDFVALLPFLGERWISDRLSWWVSF